MWKQVTNHLSSACHGILRNGVHLVLGLHLPALLLVFANLDQHDPEVGSPQVQSQEIPHLCRKTHGTYQQKSCQMNLCDILIKLIINEFLFWCAYLIPLGWSRHTSAAF